MSTLLRTAVIESTRVRTASTERAILLLQFLEVSSNKYTKIYFIVLNKTWRLSAMTISRNFQKDTKINYLERIKRLSHYIVQTASLE